MLNVNFLLLHLLEQTAFARSTVLVESYLSYWTEASGEKNLCWEQRCRMSIWFFLRTHSHTAVLQKQITCLFFLNVCKKHSRKLNINTASLLKALSWQKKKITEHFRFSSTSKESSVINDTKPTKGKIWDSLIIILCWCIAESSDCRSAYTPGG